MRNRIGRVGHLKTTVVISIGSVLISLSITLFIMVVSRTQISIVAIIISVIVPLLTAPLIVWYIVGLLLEIQQLEAKQRELASTDELTHLLSRRAYMEVSGTLLAQAAQNADDLVVAMIDIDDFKLINDTFGHGGGDAVLRSFADILRQRVRCTDVVGRVGGEEFALTLRSISADKAEHLLEEIRSLVESDRVEFQDSVIHYTISVGFAANPNVNASMLDSLLLDADKALYSVKETGKNRVSLYTEAQ